MREEIRMWRWEELEEQLLCSARHCHPHSFSPDLCHRDQFQQESGNKESWLPPGSFSQVPDELCPSSVWNLHLLSLERWGKRRRQKKVNREQGHSVKLRKCTLSISEEDECIKPHPDQRWIGLKRGYSTSAQGRKGGRKTELARCKECHVQGHQGSVPSLTELLSTAHSIFRIPIFAVIWSHIYSRISSVLQESETLLILLWVPYIDSDSAIHTHTGQALYWQTSDFLNLFCNLQISLKFLSLQEQAS